MNTLSLITGMLVQRLAAVSVQPLGEERPQAHPFTLPEAVQNALRGRLQMQSDDAGEREPTEKQAKDGQKSEMVDRPLDALMTMLLMPERPAVTEKLPQAAQWAQPEIAMQLAQVALPTQAAAVTPKQLAEQVRLTTDNLPAIASPGSQAESPRPERSAALRHAVSEKPTPDRPAPASLVTHTAVVADEARFLPDKVQPERTIGVDTRAAQWGEALVHILKENIQFQLGQQQQISTIRLDPPSLGKLEIAIQLDAGKLTVHIGASQADVCRTLQQCSDALRTQLTQQNFMQVEVQVSADGQSHSHSRQQRDNRENAEQIISAVELDVDEMGLTARDSVLIKV